MKLSALELLFCSAGLVACVLCTIAGLILYFWKG